MNTRFIIQKKNRQKVLDLYRSMKSPTIQEIADSLQIQYSTVQYICKNYIPTAEYKALSKIRYSRSKIAEKNPMFGKKEELHHNWLGLVDDGYGYLTCLRDGKRQFVHRIVMAEALGLKELPPILDVHHIDNNTKNNSL